MYYMRHDPDAVLDYKFDWSAWLSDGDTIVDHEVKVPAGVTKVSSAVDESQTAVVVWLSGGSAGTTYAVTCQITTEGGRTDERSIRLKVEER